MCLCVLLPLHTRHGAPEILPPHFRLLSPVATKCHIYLAGVFCLSHTPRSVNAGSQRTLASLTMTMRSLLFTPLMLAERIAAHAVLEEPAPRTGMSPGVGTKLTPFAAAPTYANNGCGGVANADPGVELPKLAYSPGDTIECAPCQTPLIPRRATQPCAGGRAAGSLGR